MKDEYKSIYELDEFTRKSLMQGALSFTGEKPPITREEEFRLKVLLNDIYNELIEILKEYCDIRQDYYSLVALWIIGTYLHDSFETFPYLFINAMRGSGKTRLLKLIAALCKNGDLIGSLKESVLFRTAKGRTLCIDEFESVGSKENQALRELLNACYKKGMKVKRMRKVRKPEGETFEVEEFEPYTPICMANIWGIEEVLGDRSVTMILEKSTNSYFNLIMEDFDEKPEIKDIKSRLDANLVSLCRFFGEKGYKNRWNKYIKERYRVITTHTTYTTQTTQTTLTKDNQEKEVNVGVVNDFNKLNNQEVDDLDFFNKIHDTGINGRNLELFMPLFQIAKFLNENVLNDMLQIGKTITKERREDEMIESRDVSFLDFVSQRGIQRDFTSVRQLTADFRMYIGDDEMEDKWINTKWVGKALKRLSLIKDKRRVSEGREVILNIDKAIEKMKNFKVDGKK